MQTRVREALSPSMIVALIALLVALGGTGYAAAVLGRNTVGSPQIIDGGVHAVDLGKDSVVSNKIRNGNVQPADLAPALRAGQPVLASGQLMVGWFAGGGGDSTDGMFGDGVTFPKRLPSGFNTSHVQYLPDGADFTPECAGLGKAQRGWACIYETQVSNASFCCTYSAIHDGDAIDYFGFRIYWNITNSNSFVDGQWVVRAP